MQPAKRNALLLFLLVLALGQQCFCQTIDDIRQGLRDSLRDSQFASSFAGMVYVSDEFELSGAHYKFDDADNTRLSSLALPFRRTFHPWGTNATGLYLEGVVGYAQAKESADDIYGGLIPSLQTSVDTDWTTYGGLIGLGPDFRLAEGLTLALIANGGLARIVSEADYGGPGAAVSAQLLDGLAFNWSGYTVSAGGAGRLDWIRPLGKGYVFEAAARYDYRWTETFAADDEAQEFSSQLQLLTLRSDVVGPTGLHLFDRSLDWRAFAGYRYFIEGTLFGTRNLGLLGVALELDTHELLPLGPRVSLSGWVIIGGDVTGYTVGLGFSF
jgi:hypothetical protein